MTVRDESSAYDINVDLISIVTGIAGIVLCFMKLIDVSIASTGMAIKRTWR